MGVRYNTSIVTDGLVGYWDTLNSRSYISGDSSWNNLVSSSFLATAVNSPTYSSNGNFTLNGTTQYFTVGGTPLSSSTTCSILMWINSTGSQVNFAGVFFNRVSGNISGLSLRSNNMLAWTWNNDATTFNHNTGLIVPQNTWSMIALSVDTNTTKFWLNDISNTQTYSTTSQTFNNVMIGRDSEGARFFKGKIAAVSFYNRALSDTEVKQNYSSLRGRYGV